MEKRLRVYAKYVIRSKYANETYSEDDKAICKLLPVIRNVSEVNRLEGFNYSQWWNTTKQSQLEPSKVVYYALKRGLNIWQMVRKNLCDGQYEIVANVCGSKIDVAVSIDTGFLFQDDLELVDNRPYIAIYDGKGGLTDAGKEQYGLPNRCPNRKDTEHIYATGRYSNYETL